MEQGSKAHLCGSCPVLLLTNMSYFYQDVVLRAMSANLRNVLPKLSLWLSASGKVWHLTRCHFCASLLGLTLPVHGILCLFCCSFIYFILLLAPMEHVFQFFALSNNNIFAYSWIVWFILWLWFLGGFFNLKRKQHSCMQTYTHTLSVQRTLYFNSAAKSLLLICRTGMR